MNSRAEQQQERLASRVVSLKSKLSRLKTAEIVRKSGASLESGSIEVKLLGQNIIVRLPEIELFFEGSPKPCPAFIQAIIMYYLTHASGRQLAGRWIRFGDLPEGMNYDQAFQGYTGNRLALEFGNDIDSLQAAALLLDGTASEPGDRSFCFEVLPRLPIMLVCWLGDEEFPPSYQLLFDESASYYMPTDGCAILGNLLTSKLIKANTD